MKSEWSEVVVETISFALYVPPGEGSAVHKNRPYHGFVLNDADGIKEYRFSDGQVLRVEGETLFYLPKKSSYYVKAIRAGGCYAINFDADIDDRPFAVNLRKTDSVKKSFQAACEEWKAYSSLCHPLAMCAIYEAIAEMQREASAPYLPNAKLDLIQPAIAEIEQRFTDPELTVAHLAALCHISEVYFRKIFDARFHTSPKEYIIQRRMEYAARFLAAKEFGVSQVAVLCGYSEPCHFSREFKKYFGVSPKDYL